MDQLGEITPNPATAIISGELKESEIKIVIFEENASDNWQDIPSESYFSSDEKCSALDFKAVLISNVCDVKASQNLPKLVN
jgi:hypothetical protein